MKILVPKNSNDKFDNLNNRDSSVNILKDQEFAKSRENRPQATREHGSRRKSLLEQGLFGDHEPEVLQKTVWWVIALHFGFSARDESRILQWGNTYLNKDPETNNKISIWYAERGSKTHHSDGQHQQAFNATAPATNTDLRNSHPIAQPTHHSSWQ